MSKQIPTKRELMTLLDDAAAISSVLREAIKLCADSLGDDALWAATTPLREALTLYNAPHHWAGIDDLDAWYPL